MTRRVQYLIGVSVIAPIWFIISIVLALMLTGAEDNMDMNATVPLGLQVACAVILFPMGYLLDFGPPPGFSEKAFVATGIFINALFWGFALVFLYRLIARFCGAKTKRDVL
jgi:hypothetical protein